MAVTATLQNLRHASARSIASSSGTYDEDFRSLFEFEATIPAGSTWNEACLIWINDRLSTSFDNLPDAQAAFAADQGVEKWDQIGTFIAGFPTATFSWEPEIAETPPASITFTRATIRTVLTTSIAADGSWYQTAKSGEIPYQGLRRVENLVATASHDFSDAAWVKPNVTVSGTTELASTGAGTVTQTLTLPIGINLLSVTVRRVSGTISADSDVSISLDGNALNIGSEITDSDQIIQVEADVSASGSNDVVISIATGITLNVEWAQVERLQSTSEVFGGEVNSATTYNADVAGVKYFNTYNANTVDGSGVVTEATGATITGGGYRPEPSDQNVVADVDVTTWSTTAITSVTDNGINSLGLNEYEVKIDTATSQHRVFVGTASITGSSYVIAKQGTGRYLNVRAGPNTDDYATFDLQTGTITEEGAGVTDASIEDLGDGWYKCTAINSGQTDNFLVVNASNTGTPGTVSVSFTGASETYLICHGQRTNNNFPSSPIITSGSTVTRNADVLIVDKTDAGVDQSAYSLFADVTYPEVGAASPIMSFNNTTRRVELQSTASDNLQVFTGEGVNINIARTLDTVFGTREKVAVRFAVNDAAMAVTGETTGTDGTVASVGTTRDLYIGSASTGQFKGIIHKVSSYGIGLTDDQLETLVA